jgi:TP53 regulating kinase and related kinases
MTLKLPATLTTGLGDARLLRLLGRGKSGYSYLAQLGEQQVVVKCMHDEPCAYYTFGDNKVRLEIAAYRTLCDAGLALPRLLTFDDEQGFLVKEYVEGTVADRWELSVDELESAIEQLFGIAQRLQDRGLNIDYFPTNFVVDGQDIRYIDYEVNPYQEVWSFARWGIYYWANRSGMKAYAQSGDWRHIHQSADSGVPIKAPFETRVAEWRRRYGRVRGRA